MRPIVVGYYTPGVYEKEAIKLAESLDALGYTHDLVGVPSLGSWQQNTQYKACFIKDMLNKHTGHILYLDVDAVMIKPPVILDNIDADIAACHYHNGTSLSGELLSGTVYFGPNAMPVVDRWIALNKKYPVKLPDGRLAWDQRTLRLARENCKFVELPQEYTWIIGLTQRANPHLNPVILHTRGSLRFGQD